MMVPDIILSNGCHIPILGLGTFKAAPMEIKEVIKYAIEVGYRHLDCALVYGNEKEIGDAIKEMISSGKITRKELFITSKCWNTYHRREKVLECCKKSLSSLGVDYLDLYLIHWPFAFQEGAENYPLDSQGNVKTAKIDYIQTWKGMEDCYKRGFVKSIGLSNFNSEQIGRVLQNAEVKPVVLQIESHPYLNQNDLIAFCEKRGIVVTAYCPLGSPNRYEPSLKHPYPLQDSAIKKIAEKFNKSPGQILIRYQVQRGVTVIPKSVNKDRLVENLNVFDFQLTANDMKVLNSFRKHRLVRVRWNLGPPPTYHPFEIPF